MCNQQKKKTDYEKVIMTPYMTHEQPPIAAVLFSLRKTAIHENRADGVFFGYLYYATM